MGANIGSSTLLFSKLASEHGRVISFEPDPYNVALLHSNLTENGRQNVELPLPENLRVVPAVRKRSGFRGE